MRDRVATMVCPLRRAPPGVLTVNVPVFVTVPPPVACTVNVYVPAGTAAVVVSVNVVAVGVGSVHLAGVFPVGFGEKFGVTPAGKPKVTEKEMGVLLPWYKMQIA